MKFRYNGNHKKVTAYGFDFNNGGPVDIPESSALAIRKLTGNSHFDIVDDEPLPDPLPEPQSFAIFRRKEDGSPYSKPDKVLKSKDEAEQWIEDNDLDPDKQIIMVK